MERLNRIKERVDALVIRDQERSHLYGVSEICARVARERGLDEEICAVAGLLHDIYRYRTGIEAFHAQSGAEMARVLLKRAGGFSEGETTAILTAISNHGGKAGGCIPAAGSHGFCAEAFARNAEEFARKNVRGEPGDPAFAKILRYWPEPEAYDELKNAWCAAFVYHMCMISGFPMPIKHPSASARFAGVGAWHEWAVENGLFFREEGGFAPRRGDIVIYDGIIPPERKPSNSPWHDHIGVVVSAHGQALAVAEGNVGNNNVSGILERTRGENIGGYIRVPEGFEYAC